MYIEEIDIQGVLRSDHTELANDPASAELSMQAGLGFRDHEPIAVTESEAA